MAILAFSLVFWHPSLSLSCNVCFSTQKFGRVSKKGRKLLILRMECLQVRKLVTWWAVQCTVYSVQCTVYSVQCTVYSVHCTMYSLQCTLYSIQFTVYSLQCTVYSLQCTVYSVQCTVYSVQFTVYSGVKESVSKGINCDDETSTNHFLNFFWKTF